MKERLQDAAMDLIWQNSYGTTSVDSICERANAKKGSFYYFFKSKSELAVAALDADWQKKRAKMDVVFSPTVPPLERLERYFDFAYGLLEKRRSECGAALGCPHLSIGSEVSTQDTAVRDKVQQILESKISYFESAIRDAHAMGLIDAPDAKTKAQTLFACYQGVLVQSRIQNNLKLIKEFKNVALAILGVERSVPKARKRRFAVAAS